MQFAYPPRVGVDDAVILHTSLTRLEKAGSTVRIMFFDFSRGFDTIQPGLLGDTPRVAGVDHHLAQTPQSVRVKGSQSGRLLCRAGAPQGTVLVPFLFALSTSTQLLSASSLMGTVRSTEDVFRTLWTGTCGTTSRGATADCSCPGG